MMLYNKMGVCLCLLYNKHCFSCLKLHINCKKLLKYPEFVRLDLWTLFCPVFSLNVCTKVKSVV